MHIIVQDFRKQELTEASFDLIHQKLQSVFTQCFHKEKSYFERLIKEGNFCVLDISQKNKFLYWKFLIHLDPQLINHLHESQDFVYYQDLVLFFSKNEFRQIPQLKQCVLDKGKRQPILMEGLKRTHSTLYIIVQNYDKTTNGQQLAFQKAELRKYFAIIFNSNMTESELSTAFDEVHFSVLEKSDKRQKYVYWKFAIWLENEKAEFLALQQDYIYKDGLVTFFSLNYNREIKKLRELVHEAKGMR